jgi:hypothetical protein
MFRPSPLAGLSHFPIFVYFKGARLFHMLNDVSFQITTSNGMVFISDKSLDSVATGTRDSSLPCYQAILSPFVLVKTRRLWRCPTVVHSLPRHWDMLPLPHTKERLSTSCSPQLLWENHLNCNESNVADTIARLESRDPPGDVILAARAAYSATYVEANAAFERRRDCRQVSFRVCEFWVCGFVSL